ncbi:MAG: serine hydrolase domain-containing protein [Anaerolineae bacterium]
MPLPHQQIDALFAPWNRTDSPGCVLGIVWDGKLIYERAYGMADLERAVPLKPESVLDIGSTGKQFAAMQVALLAERGDLSLDDPVQTYIPELPTYDQPITIRHLMHHSSGLRDYLLLLLLAGKTFDVSYGADELLELVCRQHGLNFKPGEDFLYSNTGYLLLGIIASRVTKTPYPELLRATFFEPLGMTASDINDDPARITRNRALSYSGSLESGFRNEAIAPGGFGDGPILSTLHDLYRWDQNFYDNRLGGGGALIQQMVTSGKFNDGALIGYGLGLFISRYRGLPVIQHGGAWAGYRAELMRFPEQRFSVILLANLGSISPTQLTKQIADLCLADVFPESIAEFPALPSDQAVDLARFEGVYQSENTRSVIELKSQKGEPIAVASGFPLKLVPETPQRWRAINVWYRLCISVEEEVQPRGCKPKTNSALAARKRMPNAKRHRLP